MTAKPTGTDTTKPINSYFDPYLQMDAVKIMPGEFCVTSGAKLIVTVLGSCVTACIRDRSNGISGMNHFMLANLNESRRPSGFVFSYGIVAMETLIQRLLQIGAQRENLEAKVFGGGSILNKFNASNVGSSSARFVHDYLIAEQIPVVAKDVLDLYPRKVYFFPDSGKVMVKKLKSLNNETIIQREQEYSARLFAS